MFNNIVSIKCIKCVKWRHNSSAKGLDEFLKLNKCVFTIERTLN
jgi:hypothetical protein